jgi:2-iminobutanoate/2-iminopropanoate deaminase
MTSTRSAIMSIVSSLTLVGFASAAKSAEYVTNQHSQNSAFSLAVTTTGGKIVWLGGQTGAVDSSGKSLANDFDGQARQVFKLLGESLEKAGGKLSDMVQMTVFITDVRNGHRLTAIRKEVFGDHFPGSALITVSALEDPNAKLEIQGYAVIDQK